MRELNFFIEIIICFGIIFFMYVGTKTVNYYYNFYHIYTFLDYEQKMSYFKNTPLINLISKNILIKKITVNYILIPIIKISYVVVFLFITLLYSLCNDEFKNFIQKQNKKYFKHKIKHNVEFGPKEMESNFEITKSKNNDSNEISENHNINVKIAPAHDIEQIQHISDDYDDDILNIMKFISVNDTEIKSEQTHQHQHQQNQNKNLILSKEIDLLNSENNDEIEVKNLNKLNIEKNEYKIESDNENELENYLIINEKEALNFQNKNINDTKNTLFDNSEKKFNFNHSEELKELTISNKMNKLVEQKNISTEQKNISTEQNDILTEQNDILINIDDIDFGTKIEDFGTKTFQIKNTNVSVFSDNNISNKNIIRIGKKKIK